ncbi:MAG TPA: 50S ribosomal protein L11 methyltransferase [Burkholderiales bacterium]
MPWLALKLQVERAAAEAFSDALLEAGAQSVALEEQGGMVVLLAHRDDAARVVAEAARQAGIPAPAFSTETVADRDWVRASQAQFSPLEVGARLWIGASWHQAPPARLAVRIDPGLAFGTGSHPTTRLVLGYLEKTLRGGERVLDFGCGSGILAIAAAKLGAAHVAASDNDPQAVETTRANARTNGVNVFAALPDDLPQADYDVVVSNILAQPLIDLAPLLGPRAGRIALAGILQSQADEVARAYAPWCALRVSDQEEDWVLLSGVRA